MADPRQKQDTKGSFADQAEKKSSGIVSEFWGLLKYYKKWWLGPIILLLLITSVLVLLLGTPVAPLIYTLF